MEFILFLFCISDLFVENEDVPCLALAIYGKALIMRGHFKLTRSILRTTYITTGRAESCGACLGV